MRLIDADALKESIRKALCIRSFKYLLPSERIMINKIDNAQTVGGWISVNDRLPEEHESIFYKLLGTSKWSKAMWKQESEKVLVYVSFPDGTGVVTTGGLHDSGWMTTISKLLPQTVTHWMPLPEPPQQ